MMTHDKRSFFDHHAAHWDERTPPDMPARLARVVAAARLQAGSCVLDVGCGTGVLIPHLLPAVEPDGHITAIDISGEMIARAQAKWFAHRVRFLQADIHDSGLPDGSFDAVFCNAVLPHLADPHRALGEMVRMLRPGGVLVISHPIGREAVNRLHQRAGEAVAQDRVPPPDRLRRWMTDAGLVQVHVVDEPEFYLATGHKPEV